MKIITEKTEIKVKKNAAVKEVVADGKALYFCNAEGMYFRLRFEGAFGWRLQASRNGKFDDLGAAQALARFMNEKLPKKVQTVLVAADKETVVLTEKKGTKAILSLGEAFSLKLCSREGAVVQEITSISFSGERTVMYGTLAENEAIYGGGEIGRAHV